MGKTMVLKSCEAVILKGVDPKGAATMFEKKHNDTSDDDRDGYCEQGISPMRNIMGTMDLMMILLTRHLMVIPRQHGMLIEISFITSQNRTFLYIHG